MYDIVEVVIVVNGNELQALSDTVDIEIETAEATLF